MERLRLIIFTLVFLIVVFFGTFGFMYVEKLSVTDAIYFSIVTISTVGYGDLHPVSQTGKFLAILLIISGGGTFFGILASATELVLNRREKRARMEKLNMIIGVFNSEVGSEMLTRFADADTDADILEKYLNIDAKWSAQHFIKAKKFLQCHNFKIDIDIADLPGLKNFLEEKSNILLRLLENPNILEHESFTQLLRAVFHVKEELAYRDDLRNLQKSDYDHLTGDIQRAYSLLVIEWLDYMRYLKNNYPYLFVFAIRLSPFASKNRI
ncbi:potassium channel family protein [Desulfonema magnum]|uniref:Ion channel domain-containing protein n=1 Tax=Desulfonema magnum TaxID=45655 RepID=A0A975GRL3_9BACT|nr:potassium channel family protein [Desulfonema magnum]QTA90118.1 Ion channel domain-containing protein [Desulfonema magnum]